MCADELLRREHQTLPPSRWFHPLRRAQCSSPRKDVGLYKRGSFALFARALARGHSNYVLVRILVRYRASPNPLDLAPEVGLEPTTNRLTADRSTTELLRNLD